MAFASDWSLPPHTADTEHQRAHKGIGPQPMSQGQAPLANANAGTARQNRRPRLRRNSKRLRRS